MPARLESAVRPMTYPRVADGALAAMDSGLPVDLAERVRELEAEKYELEQRFARELKSARHEALEQSRSVADREQLEWRQQCADRLAAALEDFRARRDEYLARVEEQVVRLALAIAERILHREAQMDPLLLAGAVRVALGQLAETTEVRLRVPPRQEEMWTEMLRLMPALPLRPEVAGDPELQDCEVTLETSLGRVDLGVAAQIAEIERGFFDLLDAREAGKQG